MLQKYAFASKIYIPPVIADSYLMLVNKCDSMLQKYAFAAKIYTLHLTADSYIVVINEC